MVYSQVSSSAYPSQNLRSLMLRPRPMFSRFACIVTLPLCYDWKMLRHVAFKVVLTWTSWRLAHSSQIVRTASTLRLTLSPTRWAFLSLSAKWCAPRRKPLDFSLVCTLPGIVCTLYITCHVEFEGAQHYGTSPVNSCVVLHRCYKCYVKQNNTMFCEHLLLIDACVQPLGQPCGWPST